MVQQLLLGAHFVVVVPAPEAVLLVDERPHVGPVVTRVGLDIEVDIEILAPIIFEILYVPDPLILVLGSFIAPDFLVLGLWVLWPDLVCSGPVLRDFLFVTPADCAALGLAQSIELRQLALRVNVHAQDPEELGLHQLMQILRSLPVQFSYFLNVPVSKPTLDPLSRRRVQR